jgi:hypothetical protein
MVPAPTEGNPMMMTAIPLPISFAPEDIGLPRRALDAICIAKITALESVLGTGSAIRWRSTGSVIPLAPAPAPKRKRATSAKVAMMSGEQFFDARMIACRAVAAEHGEHWHLIEGASQWCAIPAKLRSFVYTSDRGSTKIKCRADARLPAARYWPEGKLPEGITVSPDMPRDRTPADVVRIMHAARNLDQTTRTYKRLRESANYANRRFHDPRWRGTDSYWAETRESAIVAAWSARRELREAQRAAAELGKGKPLTLASSTTRNPRAEVISCEMDYHAHRVALASNRHRRGSDNDTVATSWRTLVQAAWDSRRRLRAARAIA